MSIRKTYLLIAILVGVATLTFSPTFAQSSFLSGMEVSLSAEQGGTSVTVSGGTSNLAEAVTISVESPDRNNVVTVQQVSPDRNGNFMRVLQTASALWSQDGFYTITTKQGERSLFTFRLRVEVIGGTTQYTSTSDSSRDTHVTSGFPFPETRFLSLDVDAILGSTTIDVRGQTDRALDVTIKVTAPNGNIVSIDQITPNPG